MTADDREHDLRSLAGRLGLTLVRSRQRNPAGWDYGLYALRDLEGQWVAADLDLDQVETTLLERVRAPVVTA